MPIIKVDSGKTAGAAVIKAWRALGAKQCGFCQSEQIMSAMALLTKNATPTDAEIDQELGGNVCHCVTHEEVRAAIRQAADDLVSTA